MSPTPELDWNDIPLMLSLARAGSMSSAARELGVDVSTISRRVAAVEAVLNTRLFIRSNRGYEPTDAGAVFMARAENVIGEVRAMLTETRAEAEGVSGPVRITAVSALFDRWLVRRLPELLEAHPKLQIQLLTDNSNLSFTRREADFALRLAKPTEDAALVMRRLGDIGFGVYGAPRFAGLPPERWGEQGWLSYRDDLSGLPEMRWLSQLRPEPQRVLQVSNVTTLIEACEAGLGLALLPWMIGDTSGLCRLSSRPEVRRELWLLGHRDAARIKRFRAVGDWLHQAFAADAARVFGSG